jgi:uncharacterized membrane protein YgdD (TMEM256/DUF423 family)
MSGGTTWPRRALAAGGALGCAAAIALAAAAMHGLHDAAAQRAALAAGFLFAHGLALLLLAPGASAWRLAGLGVLALGLLLFAGSLAGAAFFALPTVAAPFGGLLLMLAWLIIAADALRR